jgi:hypothetical protein
MDKVKYVNHLGETLDLRSAKIMSSYEALKAFVMSMSNNRLTSEGKTTPLPVVCLSIDAANKLINTLEKDSIKNKYGKLYINDWYIKVIYQGLSPIMRTSDKVKFEIRFYAEDTIFTKETSYQLSATSTISGNGLNFPFNFPFNFGADPIASASVTNNELLDADFVLKFDKPTSDISISIDANSYIIDAAINEGETFVLDTAEKEVYKLTQYGKTSLLGAADDASYIFNPISNGQHKVTWNGDFSLFLTLLEHRRTPIWI